MFRNRLYYRIKPLLPATMRMSVRRWFAVRKREELLNTWPILPGSEKSPENWPGWPDGKQFALVLTHDIEGQSGLDKVRPLVELEQKLGFRSSFNFVPEGDYTVARELREELTRNGFEVGVHDLHHDGKLYRSRHEFSKSAARINHYLKEWGATGFRSGFMLHNLDWLHELQAAYDASTFDTDPFEPQPDGVGTIFPFWVQRKGDRRSSASPNSELRTPSSELCSPLLAPRSGYVELPYTLPQDSTLFLLLRERHPDIWFQKLDWVARHGGMALLDAHPDFMAMGKTPPAPSEYPVELYARFLEYARQRWGGAYWQPLPMQMARFVAYHRPLPPRKAKRICMVTYSAYESDARVTRYAEALAERGDHVDVLALRQSPNFPVQETIAGVNVLRIQQRFAKIEQTKLSFLFPVLRFLLHASLQIAREHSRKPFDVLHMHNVPDFIVFAAWYPKLLGAKVVLDIHDILPEFYANKFFAPEDSRMVALLRSVEKAAARFSNRAIIANHLWLEKYAARTGANGKCSVFINNVDPHIFHPRPRTRNDGKFIVLFPGGLQWHQGLDIALRAFAKVEAEARRQKTEDRRQEKDTSRPARPTLSASDGERAGVRCHTTTPSLRPSTIPAPPPLSLATRHLSPSEIEFHIYGDGNMKQSLVALVRDLNLDEKVRFFDPLPVRQIADIMANADLGVVPKRADSFGNEAYSTKIMEFMALGVPVVVSSTRIDTYYFDDSVVRFFESGNPDALAAVMLDMILDPELRRSLVARGLDYAAQNSWDSKKADYLALIDSLASDSTSTPGKNGAGEGGANRPTSGHLQSNGAPAGLARDRRQAVEDDRLAMK